MKKVKNAVSWTYIISDFNGEEVVGTFYERELQKTSQKQFRIGKVIKIKDDILCIKMEGYDNSFNCQINMKDIV